MKKYLSYAAVAVIVIGIAGVYLHYNPTAQPAPVVSADSEGFGRELSDEEKIGTTREVLQILNELYFVTQESADIPEPETVSEIVMDLMTESLNDKLRVESLISQADKLVKSDNKVVQAVGLGMFVGFKQLVEAENNLVAHLRTTDSTNPDVSEFQYQLAAFGAAQKEAFRNITIGVGMLPSLYWDLGDGMHKPTDPIPYSISVDARASILAEIDRLFGDDIIADEKNHALTGETNSVIFAVNNMVEGLRFDTFAEYETYKATQD